MHSLRQQIRQRGSMQCICQQRAKRLENASNYTTKEGGRTKVGLGPSPSSRAWEHFSESLKENSCSNCSPKGLELLEQAIRDCGANDTQNCVRLLMRRKVSSGLQSAGSSVSLSCQHWFRHDAPATALPSHKLRRRDALLPVKQQTLPFFRA